ncbi:MAG: hypothetical protein PHH68_01265 [Candidatus Omnitrophica bacterium]|nr:hypothetical protein [Candidatus Omnitrophota bacterium]MDD5078940.1 hypothetical protein [Candidatus Omnitrophota bacterium]
MRKAIFAFTIVELTVVLIVVGILVTLAIGQFSGSREQALKKEAQANLKLIAAAEKIYRLETTVYMNQTDSSAVNSNLKLSLPITNPNWNYKVIGANTTTFTAKAGRVKDSNVTVLCINQTTEEPYNGTGCSW